MKLDVVVSSLRGGGAERVAANLASGWAQSGHKVRLIMMGPLSEVEYHPDPQVELVGLSSDWKGLSNPLRRILSRLRLLRHALNGPSRADLVIAIQSNLAIEAGLACMGTGIRIIGCEHNTPSRAVNGWLWLRLRPFVYRRLAAVVTLTHGAIEELKPICGKTPLYVIPNALRLPLPVTPQRLPPENIIHPDAPLLLSIGRMVKAKGFDILISRFAQLSAMSPEVRLVILGDGPLRSVLETQIQALGLADRAFLPGRAGNISEWYKRAEIFVMTSRWEGMPMVLMEAMGHGLVPVVTDFKHGPRDLIRNGTDGIILPETDDALWSETVTELLGNAELMGAMRERALEVRTRFSEDTILKAWNALFDDVKWSGHSGISAQL